MSCPSRSELEALLRVPDTGAAAPDLARHLNECAACRAALEDLAGGTAWSAAGRRLHSSPNPAENPLVAAVIHDLQAQPDAPPKPHGEPLDFLGPATGPDMLGTFGPYEVLSHIASGGMGVVLKARDPVLNRIVALKVLAPALARRGMARSRFIREARAAAAVVHDHVVSIHAVDEFNGLPFLVMQFIKGRSLAERLQATGPMRLEEMLRIGAQIAAGLAAAHAQGLIHRDVKPGNVLLENGVERVKLTDFGLARALDDASLTCTGEIAGTPEYMSPEQAAGEAVDARSDLFSLGCILYAMATGASPFRADTSLAVLRRVCDFTPRPLVEEASGTPPWFSEIVERLMAKRPADRFQTAAEIEALLTSCLQSMNTGRPPGLEGRTRLDRARGFLQTRGPQVAAGVILALLAGGALWRFTPPGPASELTDHAGQTDATTPEPFAVLKADGSTRVTFKRMQDAVDAARSGDIIELNRSGRFSPGPVRVRGKALTIRAAATASPEWQHNISSGPALESDSPLALEGLLFSGLPSPAAFGTRRLNWRERPAQSAAASGETMVRASGGALLLAHCQFRSPWEAVAGRPGAADIMASNAALVELRHCRLVTPWIKGLVWRHSASAAQAPERARLTVTNSVLFNAENLWLEAGPLARLEVDIARTVFRERAAVVLAGAEAPQSIHVLARQCVFASRFALDDERPAAALPLNTVCEWEDRANLFSDKDCHYGDAANYPAEFTTAKRWSRWNEYWEQTGKDSVVGQFKLSAAPPPGMPTTATPGASFVNGLSVVQGDAEAADRPQAFGIALEGTSPGSTGYHRWRSSPEYAAWRAHVARVFGGGSGPSKSANAGSAADFALLTPAGEQHFPTLGTAIAAAAPGATIEARFDGPITLEPVQIPAGRPLRIVAGEGFRPILLYAQHNPPLIQSDSALVLEGLTIEPAPALRPDDWTPANHLPPSFTRHPLSQKPRPPGGPRNRPRNQAFSPILRTTGPAIFLAHCRILNLAGTVAAMDQAPPCLSLPEDTVAELRSSELLPVDGLALRVEARPGQPTAGGAGPEADLRLLNSLFLCRDVLNFPDGSQQEYAVSLERCTLSGLNLVAGGLRSISLNVSARQSIFDLEGLQKQRGRFSRFDARPNWRWSGAQNVFAVAVSDSPLTARQGPDWSEQNSRAVNIAIPEFAAYQGPLETLSAAQFAAPAATSTAPGPAGANFAGVGPGPAYHAWRRSPAFAEWLERTRALLNAAPQSR